MGLSISNQDMRISVFGTTLHDLADDMQWEKECPDAEVHLTKADGRLAIQIPADEELNTYNATSFNLSQIRIDKQAGLKQALVRACGLHKRSDLRICDACAGTGVDAYILSHFAAEVVSCERHPVVLALLNDARLRDASHLPWSINGTDAQELIQNDQHFDVLYLDPMFQLAKRRGAERKEMRILSYLEQAAGDDDSASLFQAAAVSPIPRLVIKRGAKMPVEELPHRRLTHSVSGKGFRLDVYQRIAQ